MGKLKKDTRLSNLSAGAKKSNEEILIFVNHVPPSTNRIWVKSRAGGIYVAPAYRQFISAVSARVRDSGARFPAEWKYCAVEIIVHPTRRWGDIDNRIKAVLDALTKAGFWRDDSVVAEVKARFGKPDRQGSTLIVITERMEKFGEN